MKHAKKDIKRAINFLKTNHPEVEATQGEAIKILDGMSSFAKSFVGTMIKGKKKLSN